MGNILLLLFHWLFALQYLRASLVFEVLLLAPTAVGASESLSILDSHCQSDNADLDNFMKAYK